MQSPMPLAPPQQPAASRQLAQRLQPLPPAHQHQPLTPLVNLVLWLICGTGWIIGWSSGPHVLESSTFRAAFMDEGAARLGPVDAHALERSALDRGYCIGYMQPISAMYLATRYIVGFAAAVPVGWVTRVQGRRFSLACGFAAFAAAHALRAAAVNWAMLFASQVLDGISVGFLYQAPYLEAVEVAPDGRRGLFVYTDQIGRSMGVWSRSLMQEGIANQAASPAWGWRVVTAFAIFPALFLVVVTIYIPETPSSLIQRGKLEAGRAALHAIRGPLYSSSVEAEFKFILAAAGIGECTREGHWSQARKLVRREQLPPLLLLVLLTAVRELTGGDFILLMSTPMQKSMGIAGPQGGFYNRQVVNATYLVASCLGAYMIDAWGRVPTFAVSSAVAALGHAVVAAILAHEYNNGIGMSLASVVCLNAAIAIAYGGYALAWGGGFWLLLAELFPLCTRSFAVSLGVAATFALYSISSALAWRWLCALRWGVFVLFATANTCGLVLVLLLMPEVAGVPLECLQQCFAVHWLWRRLVAGSSDGSSSSSSRAPPQQQQQSQQPQQQEQQEQQPEPGTTSGHALIAISEHGMRAQPHVLSHPGATLLLQPSSSLQRRVGSGALPLLPSGGGSNSGCSSAFGTASSLQQAGSHELQQGGSGALGGGGLIALARTGTGTRARTISMSIDLEAFKYDDSMSVRWKV